MKKIVILYIQLIVKKVKIKRFLKRKKERKNVTGSEEKEINIFSELAERNRKA